MDNPRYIILVALDTPSRSTGIYISGGVMAAPTVGAVMADILPYLEVDKAEKPQSVTVPDLTGMTQKEAEKALLDLGLRASFLGTEESVTTQLPSGGQAVSVGSELLVYLGDTIPDGAVTVPDFSGMTVAQAADAAQNAGLYLLPAGNPDLNLPLQVLAQSIPAGASAEPGSIVTIQFADPQAHD